MIKSIRGAWSGLWISAYTYYCYFHLDLRYQSSKFFIIIHRHQHLYATHQALNMHFHTLILLTTSASLILASTIPHSHPPSNSLSHLFLPRQDTCPQGTPDECDCSTDYIACDVTGGNWAQGIDNGTSDASSSTIPSSSITISSSATPTTSTAVLTSTTTTSSTPPPAATTTAPAGLSPQQQCHDRCGGGNGQSSANMDWCIAMCGCYFDAAGC